MSTFQDILREKELKTGVGKPALTSLSVLWQLEASCPDAGS